MGIDSGEITHFFLLKISTTSSESLFLYMM